ncbi:hypothetical protein EG327_002298 [Venturia inaequalis]|uniref:Alpha-galactosidase n=1 Tax=Venturia inaequalis TaxID=5025 RepID=A0A8H3VW84_VENIN|nr:hypothetical protein EG327_002298 [Venturia inaequalis]
MLTILSLFVASAAALVNPDGTVTIPGASSYNGLNLVPQMGWDNWNAFGCNINETILLDTAKAMISYGLRDLGYNYVVLDDCWSQGRNGSGYIEHDPTKFPNGMKLVADAVHALGMKFGMYSSAGKFTCGKYPGSLDNEQKDADLFASWGVDYLKYDNCYNLGRSGTPKLSFDRYDVMSKALNATGRPILYAMCNWGNDDPYDWAYDIANSYRMSGDIYDSFNRPDSRCPCDDVIGCKWPGFHCSVMNILNKMGSIVSRTMSGSFADMDMLEVGNGGQTDEEYKTHFSMWAMMSSPLLIGTNVLALTPANLAIYSNPAVIALNQDPSAGAGTRKWRYLVNDTDIYGQGEISLWTRTLKNGDRVIALLNGGNSTRTMNATLTDIFLDEATAGTYVPAAELEESWDVYDLWANRMSNTEAAALINGTAPIITSTANSTTRYNATALSWVEGLNQTHAALFGVKVGSIAPRGTWTAEVARHGVGLFRLRKVGGAKRKRDEL